MAISFSYAAHPFLHSPVTQNRIREILQATNRVQRELDSSHGQIYACAKAGFDKTNQKMGSSYTIFVMLEYFDQGTKCIDLILGSDPFQVRCPLALHQASRSWADQYPPEEIVSVFKDVFDKKILDRSPSKPPQPMNNPPPPSSSTQPSPNQLNVPLNRSGGRQIVNARTGRLQN